MLLPIYPKPSGQLQFRYNCDNGFNPFAIVDGTEETRGIGMCRIHASAAPTPAAYPEIKFYQ
jgi:hypothetical protein